MNKPIIVLLAVVAIAIAIAAPVVATDRDAKSGMTKCSMFKKFDKKTKRCVSR